MAQHQDRAQGRDNSERETTLAILRGAFPKGSTVYTILRSASRSGMARQISVIGLQDDGPRFWSNAVASALGMKSARVAGDAAVKVNGCGMDMGFHLAYELSVALYGDGYALRHRWL